MVDGYGHLHVLAGAANGHGKLRRASGILAL